MKNWVIFLLQPTDPDISRIQSLSSAQLTWPAVHMVHSSLTEPGLRVCLFWVSSFLRWIILCHRLRSIWLPGLWHCVSDCESWVSFYSTLFAPAGTLCARVVCVCVCFVYQAELCVCSLSTVWQEPPALGCLQRPHWGCAYPAQSRLRPGHPRRREYLSVCQLRRPCVHFSSTSSSHCGPERWITFYFYFLDPLFFFFNTKRTVE